jgi:hypothetical protein
VDAKTIDWSEFTDEEIDRFITELEAEREKRGEEKRRVLKEQIEGMIKEHGVSLAELFPQTGREEGSAKGEAPTGRADG